MKWGAIIKERRAVLGISQQDLADISEISVRTIKMIEVGGANPSVNTLERIGFVLGLELVFQIRSNSLQ